jgi:hypothetical protein
LNPSRAIEPFLPIGFAHVVNANSFAGTWGVNEFTVPHINTHVAEGSFQGVEENQVARLEFTATDFFSDFGLLFCSSGQHQAHRLFIHVAHKPAAIKAFFFAATAPLVGHSQQPHGLNDQF